VFSFALFIANKSQAQCTVTPPVPEDECYFLVVDDDSFCCFDSWDGLCQSAYDDCINGVVNCNVFAPVPNNACYQQIITDLPECCNDAWSQSCQTAYNTCLNIDSGCNTDVSICTSGTAGPFTFDQNTLGPPFDYAFPLGCSTGTGGNDFGFGFIILYITQTGPLNLLVDGNSNNGFIDVIVYNIPSNSSPCDAVLDQNNEIGCNYAPSSVGCTQFGTDFPCESSVDAPIVQAGQRIMIIAHDFSSQSTTFSLDLGPTGAQTGPPNATITSNVPVLCSTDLGIQLSAVNQGGVWTGNGVSEDGFFNPLQAGVGTHLINYSIGTVPCNDSDIIEITVVDCNVETCSITAISNSPICYNGFLNLSANNIPGANYEWTSNSFSSSEQNPSSIPVSEFVSNQKFYVTATIGNVTCSDSLQINIIPKPFVSAGGKISICEGDSVLINAIGNGSIVWENNLLNFSYIKPNLGENSYIVSITDANNCINSDTLIVNVRSQISTSFDATLREGCAPLRTTIYTTNDFQSNNNWYINGLKSLQTGDSISFILNDIRCHDVYLASSIGTCYDSVSFNDFICVFPNPKADFYFTENTLSLDETKLFFKNTSIGANVYFWDFGISASTSQEFEPIQKYEINGLTRFEIQLTVSNEFNCRDSIVKIYNYQEIENWFVPNSFSPNGDEFNNTFKPIFSSKTTPIDYLLTIFNSWGEIIFQSRDIHYGWDGTFGNQFVKNGSYIWVIDYYDSLINSNKQINGSISVLK
jgi:gliding motility-associated-like protein